MPRLKEDPRDVFYRTVVANINYLMDKRGLNVEEVSKYSCIKPSTLRDKKRNPRKIDLEEVYNISKALRVKPDQLLRELQFPDTKGEEIL